MPQPNRSRYLESVSAELKAQATRVRDLIGDRHWLSDGHHKEYLVKDALSRHVPSGVLLERGFVVHPERSDLVSREQDIVLGDNLAIAPLFSQGGLSVLFPSQVLGAIAVKTTLNKAQLIDACKTLHSVRRICSYAGMEKAPWCGALFFEPGAWSLEELCENVGEVLVGFERDAEQLGSMRSAPDVIAVLGHAGFVVDPIDATSREVAVRGFSGDGAVMLLNSLLDALARARGADAGEFERFAGSIALPPLLGSPFR